MNPLQPATLEDIATRAGVSVGTVSRILNGKNKENRPAIAKRAGKIRTIAEQMGYRPNAAARSMIRGAFRSVAFVTCGDLGNDWYPISALNSIHSALEALEWKLTFNELPASKIANPELVPHLFREASVDGLIINLLPVFSEGLVDYFESQPLPCTWLNLKRPRASVYPDEETGAQLGVKRLIENGRRRIGYFSGLFRAPAHYSVQDRFAGFTSSMKSAGLPPTRYLNFLASSQEPVGTDYTLPRAHEFLRTFPDVDGVLCYECSEAICLAMAAERMGRRVPEDLEIVAFSEREVRAISGLSIPTIIIPFAHVGTLAVGMLQQMIDNRARDIPSVAVGYKSILV